MIIQQIWYLKIYELIIVVYYRGLLTAPTMNGLAASPNKWITNICRASPDDRHSGITTYWQESKYRYFIFDASINPLLHHSVYPFIHLLIHSSIHPSINPFHCPSIYPFIHPSTHPSIIPVGWLQQVPTLNTKRILKGTPISNENTTKLINH